MKLLSFLGRGVGRTSSRAAVWSLAIGALGLAAASCSAELEREEVSAEHEEIVNGDNVTSANNPHVVALYHQSLCESGNTCCPTVGQMYWFPRPCSATILRSLPNETWLLTARHCVTRTGTIEGTLVAPNQLRVNYGLVPGLALPNPPTAGSFTPNLVIPNVAGTTSGYDIALVRVPAAVPFSARRVSLPMNEKLGSSARLIAYGYGRFVETVPAECETGSSGAGRLRTAQDFDVTGSCSGCPAFGTYDYFDRNARGQSVWRGDSGGPSFLQSSASTPFLEMVGVHSTGCLGCEATDTRVAGAIDFILSTLGHLYISAHSSPATNLGVVGNIQNGARVTTRATGDSLNTRWVWEKSTRRIYTRDAAGTRYYLTAGPLIGIGNRYAYITSGSVSGGSQKWSLSLDRLWNDAPGETGSECLIDTTSGAAEVGPCTGGPTRTFAWHTNR